MREHGDLEIGPGAREVLSRIKPRVVPERLLSAAELREARRMRGEPASGGERLSHEELRAIVMAARRES